MSMSLSNALRNQTITDNHFLHHPKANSKLIRKHGRGRMDMKNIYLPPLARDNNHNCGGKSAVEIRKLGISKESWPFNYVTETCREFNGVTTIGRMLYRNLKVTSVLDKIYGGIYKKAHVATELAGRLRLNLFMKGPFDPVEDYTAREITLGPGCNVPGYTGTTVRYTSTLPTSQAKGRINERPRIDIYIDRIMTVSEMANPSGFASAALPNANIKSGNNPITGIEAYPGTAEVRAKIGYKIISGNENAPLRRMTLQPSSLPELFELKNGKWSYMVMLPTYQLSA